MTVGSWGFLRLSTYFCVRESSPRASDRSVLSLFRRQHGRNGNGLLQILSDITVLSVQAHQLEGVQGTVLHRSEPNQEGQMRYVIYWLITCIVFTVFFFMNNANAQQNLNDPKWGMYHSCLGWHHHLGEDIIEKAKASKDSVQADLAVWIVHINAKAACAKYLPKEKQ